MSSFRQLMMKAKGHTPNPPANVVVTQSGTGVILNTNVSPSIIRYLKFYDGLAYCGYVKLFGSGNNWAFPMFVSEDRNACLNKRSDAGSSTISSSTFNYYGKDWYYLIMADGIPFSQVVSSNNYLIGDGTSYAGDSQFLDSAKALLDYVYSF